MSTATEAIARPTAEPPAEVKSMLDGVIVETERKVSTDTMSYAFARMEEWSKMARALVRSALLPQKNEAQVITCLMMAHDMKLPQMVALRGMYVVGGKVGMEAWLMDMVATQIGVSKEVASETPTECHIILHHKDRPSIESSFSLAEAKGAGLIRDFDDEGNVTPMPRRDIWKAYTRDMLYWRALSRGLRRIAPDMFGGVYLREETQGFADRGGETGTATDTNAELAALTEAVEPDPDEMTLDEIDQMAREFSEGVADGLVTPMDEQIANNLAIDGKWSAAREAWDELRSKRLREDAA